MKKLLVVSLALFTLAVCANAQRTPGTPKTHSTVTRTFPKRHKIKNDGITPHRMRIKARRHRHHAMMQHLNLSGDQKQQAKLYRENNLKQLQELNKNENITVKEFRDRKLVLHKEQQAKMQSLLTPEQKTQLAQLKAEHKQKEQQHYAARMDKMKTKLNLSDDQVAKIKAQHEAMGAKLKAIKEDDKLDRVTKQEKLAALKSQAKEAHQKIFTPEQLQKLEEMKQHKGQKHNVK